MADSAIALMAHLLRRAGFGAPRSELETRVSRGYEETVEELLHPEDQEPLDIYEFLRYLPWQWHAGNQDVGQASWVWRMISTRAPLQEKMTAFYHGLFATGVAKVDHYHEIVDMVDMFRDRALGKYGDILVDVARNPAMIYWLDNNQNHADSVNENWGRELLELFTMGVGSYTEQDVMECSRAFTGWTITPKIPRYPMGRFDWTFEYKDFDHDDGEKTFLGHTGRFNGEDVIEIILQQPATAYFIARHLYNFFVADEAQVSAWSVTRPRDPEAVDLLAGALMDSGYDMRSVLRLLFNSDFFKASRFAKVKSPFEAVVGAVRLVGDDQFPKYVGYSDVSTSIPDIMEWSNQIAYMGQDLLNPPSVEGWHTGTEWINSGSLMKRTNFFAEMFSDLGRPGTRYIVGRLKSEGSSPETFVDTCLDLVGPLEIDDESRDELVAHTSSDGALEWDTQDQSEASAQRVAEMLQLIVSLREYQLA